MKEQESQLENKPKKKKKERKQTNCRKTSPPKKKKKEYGRRNKAHETKVKILIQKKKPHKKMEDL